MRNPEKDRAARLRARQNYLRTIKLRKNEPTFATGRGYTSAVRSGSEVAKMLGISKQAVHQIERVAIYKLRLALLPLLLEINPELAKEIGG